MVRKCKHYKRESWESAGHCRPANRGHSSLWHAQRHKASVDHGSRVLHLMGTRESGAWSSIPEHPWHITQPQSILVMAPSVAQHGQGSGTWFTPYHHGTRDIPHESNLSILRKEANEKKETKKSDNDKERNKREYLLSARPTTYA